MLCVDRTDSSQYSLLNHILELTTFEDVVNQDVDICLCIHC